MLCFSSLTLVQSDIFDGEKSLMSHSQLCAVTKTKVGSKKCVADIQVCCLSINVGVCLCAMNMNMTSMNCSLCIMQRGIYFSSNKSCIRPVTTVKYSS